VIRSARATPKTSEAAGAGASTSIGRRTVLTGAAWSLPVIALAVATPGASASGGAVVVGSYVITGDCGVLFTTDVSFTLTASSTAPLPVGTQVQITSNNPGEVGEWVIDGGTATQSVAGTVHTFVLTSEIPVNGSVSFRSDLNQTQAFVLTAATTLPGGYVGSGAEKSTATIDAAAGTCSTS
jgi:hypothetical protein